MSSVDSELTIATANVHFGDMIRQDGGLDPLEEYTPDILLLQEVINPQAELQTQLGKANYRLIHAASRFGLAIALRKDSHLRLVEGSVRIHELGKMGTIERALAQRWAKRPHDMTAHGMLAAQFKTPGEQKMTAISTRVTVSSNRRGRKQQIMGISQALTDPYYSGAVILGGDMNHFPEPQPIDRAMHQSADITPINLAGEPTWRAKRSPVYIAAAFIRGQRVENMSAELDALLYKPSMLTPTSIAVIDTISDHRAIVDGFRLQGSGDA